MDKREIKIHVPALARVEGEGALDLHIHDGAIAALQLRIYEPPRYFEQLLVGRDYTEVPDLVARICGICPVAYQMSAVQALEKIIGYTPPPWLQALRRVMYCGEWIQSHSLHIHMLAAPDLLGFDSITAMATQYGNEVRRGLLLQGLGNALIELLGARSVHPVGVKVGGFHRLPSYEEREALRRRLLAALPQAAALLRWTATLPLPDDDQDFVCLALRHGSDYPMQGDRLVSTSGLDIDIEEFEQHIIEQQVPHSTALHALLHGEPYLLGPLARLNLNGDRLPPALRAILADLGVRFPSRNMFHSIVARAAEIWLALHEAARLLAWDSEAEAPVCPTPLPRAGTAAGCTEAPRGMLWHRYEMDGHGAITRARIVPPTSQNQARIEADLRASLTRFGLDRPEQAIRLRAEMVIRNYDPCISCATHFLKLRVARDATGQTTRSPALARRVVVLGVGTEHAGDDVGLRLIERLRDDAALAPYLARGRLMLHACRQPMLDWPRCVREGDSVFIIDALRAAAADGLRIIDGAALADAGRALSSHALGVGDAQAWPAAVGQVAADVTVLGVRIDAAKSPPDAVSLTRLVEQVRERLLARLPGESPSVEYLAQERSHTGNTAASAGTTRTTR